MDLAAPTAVQTEAACRGPPIGFDASREAKASRLEGGPTLQAAGTEGGSMSWRNEGSALGEAAAELLLSHSQWIFRRVESVDFRDDGITRRRVSFDFQVPRRCLISWGPVGTESHAEDLIATPLSFMRKGLLVNLDVVDGAGSSVPIAGFGDNGLLATAALEHLAKASGVIRESVAQVTNAESEPTPADGIFCVVHSLVERFPVGLCQLVRGTVAARMKRLSMRIGRSDTSRT